MQTTVAQPSLLHMLAAADGNHASSEFMRTLTPFSVILDDLVDKRDISKSAALRFANNLGISTLIGTEEHNIKHGCSRRGTDTHKIFTVQSTNTTGTVPSGSYNIQK